MSARGPVDALGLTGRTVDQVRFDACVDSGGFGLIYRGQHLGLGETVAIKCLRIMGVQKADEGVRESIAARFRDETKLLYRLSQGNLDIVRCIGSGTVVAPTTKELTPYMVLEWLDGCTLSAEMKERREQKMPPRSLEATVRLLDSAASGIAYAHSLDVVHRDIKPGNLFITRTRDGGVRMKVLDFGLAKILSDETIGMRPSVETAVGTHFCSPSYGAPEQFSAQFGKIGTWTDVYSLALVLLECLKGEKIRPASTLAEGLLKAIDPKTASPKPSSLGIALPPAVEELFGRALAQNPMERPRDVGVFWSALKDAMAAPRPMLQATMHDSNMAEAMNEVRAAAARASQRPAPLVGTLMMDNAPAGAPHMPPAAGAPHIRPAAGAPPPAAGAPPDASRPPPNKLAMTMPLGAASPLSLGQGAGAPPALAHSPLASSIAGSGPPPPMPPSAMPPGAMPPGAMPPAMPPHGMAGPAMPPSMPPQGMAGTAAMPGPTSLPGPSGERGPPPRTDPRANISQSQSSQSQSSQSQGEIPMTGGKGLLVGIILLFLLAVGGLGFWWFRLRGH